MLGRLFFFLTFDTHFAITVYAERREAMELATAHFPTALYYKELKIRKEATMSKTLSPRQKDRILKTPCNEAPNDILIAKFLVLGFTSQTLKDAPLEKTDSFKVISTAVMNMKNPEGTITLEEHVLSLESLFFTCGHGKNVHTLNAYEGWFELKKRLGIAGPN